MTEQTGRDLLNDYAARLLGGTGIADAEGVARDPAQPVTAEGRAAAAALRDGWATARSGDAS